MGTNNLKERINESIKYIESLKITLEDISKKVIVNDYFFYTIKAYNTKERNECKTESHKNYIDIQYIYSGTEMLECADIAHLTIKTPYDDTKDVMFYHDAYSPSTVKLSAGDYIVLYPEHGHKACIMNGAPSYVIKVIGKVKID